MKYRLFAFAALLTLGAAAPPPGPDAIAFKISSWGKPLTIWRIDASGAATFTHSVGTDFRTYRLVTRRFDAGTKGFAEIRALLAPAQRAAGSGWPACEGRITDQPYGNADWTIGGKASSVSFDLGCQSKALGPLHRAFAEADARMEKWAAKGEIIEDREVVS